MSDEKTEERLRVKIKIEDNKKFRTDKIIRVNEEEVSEEYFSACEKCEYLKDYFNSEQKELRIVDLVGIVIVHKTKQRKKPLLVKGISRDDIMSVFKYLDSEILDDCPSKQNKTSEYKRVYAVAPNGKRYRMMKVFRKIIENKGYDIENWAFDHDAAKSRLQRLGFPVESY